MSSNLYARYVPPPRNREHAVPHTWIPPHTSPPPDEPHIPQPPATQADASATYTRYIPPSSKSMTQAEELVNVNSPALLKRKHDVNHSETSKSKKAKKAASATAQEDIDRKGKSKLKNEKPKSNKKDKIGKKKTESFAHTTIEEEEDDDERSEEEDINLKHKSLMSKRTKSIKKSEKLARKTSANTAESGISEQKELEEPPELYALGPLPQPGPAPEATGLPAFSALPPWLASPIRISPVATAAFSQFGLPSLAIDVLQSKGFKEAFAVQAAVLPLLLPKGPEKRQRTGDVLVSAATGSGKTLAYVLPMVGDISQTTVTRLRGLIIMPTRELVMQAREVTEICATVFSATKRRHIRIGIAVGSQTFKSEQVSLMKEELRYNPEEYRRREHRLNAKWESSDLDTDDESWDENFKIYDEETVSRLPGHVSEYSPKVDVLICTPGRLVEHLKSTAGFTLDYVKWLIIDEADKLLDQSFQQWLPTVMSKLPKEKGSPTTHSVTKIVLSATMTRDVGQLNELKLFRPRLVVLEGSEAVDINDAQKSSEVLSLPATLHESAIKIVNEGDKPLYLLKLLRDNLAADTTSNLSAIESASASLDESSSNSSRSGSPPSPSNASSGSEISETGFPSNTRIVTIRSPSSGPNVVAKSCLVFTKSNETAVRLGRLISILEPTFDSRTGVLTSTVPHSTRKATLSAFNSGKISILFASDLVSRGLDLPDLAHVINYDIPTSLTSYVHRVGRTARAGKQGYAWTLFSTTEARWFWNDIARSSSVRRTAGKVARVNIDASLFSSEERQHYEAALTALGKEAGSR